jgi:hypothetical protein
MKTPPKKLTTAAPQKPISLRINAATRSDLDYLVEISGLKQAQVIRQTIRRMAHQARVEGVPAPKAARSKR